MDKSNQGEGKFFSGLLLGILIGAAVVFLLATKKGKKLLKAISEEKLDNISDILNEKSKTIEVEDNKEEVSSLRAAVEQKEEVESTIERPKARRFFRGISRRVVN